MEQRMNTTHLAASAVACPFCQAAPGQPCRENIGGTMQSVSIHLSRVSAAVAR
jgi:hypothetical protein